MKIALDAAKFSSEEANQLRKAMATFRSRGNIEVLQDKMVGRMVERGYDPDFAQRCFDQIKGFGEYGFPESHAASFAHLVYVSSWLKWKYPAAFACGAAQLAADGLLRARADRPRRARAWRRGARGRCEPQRLGLHAWRDGALRLGLRQVEGLHREAAERLAACAARPYATRRGFAHAAAACRCMRSSGWPRPMRSGRSGLDRRAALWDSRALKPGAGPAPVRSCRGARRRRRKRDAARSFRPCRSAEHVVNDYQTIRLSLKAHPMRFLREHYAAQKFVTADQLEAIRDGKRLSIAGLVLIRQRPGSAKGVCFITHRGRDRHRQPRRLARRVRQAAQDRHGRAADGGARHHPERRDDGVIHVVARRLEDHSHMLRHLSDGLMPSTLNQGDGAGSWRAPAARHPRDVEIIPKSRDFH